MTGVVGVDLSLASTGVVDTDGVPELITTTPRAALEDRLLTIADRLEAICAPASLVVVEDLPVGMRNAAAGWLGMVHGVVRARLYGHQHRRLVLVPPATLKVFATGRGNASKADMRVELVRRADLDVRSDDLVDAWWLRALGCALEGHPIVQLPRTHLRALDLLR